jgi:hypothetical protein
VLAIVPGFQPPTGSLSTTAALALCVFLAVPVFGIRKQGLRGYFRQYIQPTPIMLPFNIIGELSRTLALAVRLFGNVMSGGIDRRHPACHCAPVLPDFIAGARIADGRDPGLYLFDSGDGLHRICAPAPILDATKKDLKE